MPNITIDSDKFKAVLDALAGLIPKPEPPPKAAKRGRPPKNNGMCPNCSEAYMYCACADNPLNKKDVKPKGRPKKVTPISNDVFDDPTLTSEEVTSIIQERLLAQPANTVSAKRPGWVPPSQDGGERTICQAQDFLEGKKELKCIDLSNVGERIPSSKYPPRSDRRDPAKKMKFTCSKCGRSFEDYPSVHPEAFARFSAADIGYKDDRARVLCDNCHGH